ncbi:MULTISPECIES: hypothetical protein [Providencia]|nr:MULTISPECIES: hypothetical protein [Providencia]SUC41075.1 Uncharacterised protein [Providencia stuartii]
MIDTINLHDENILGILYIEEDSVNNSVYLPFIKGDRLGGHQT